MKANELRIGNLIYDTEGKPNYVTIEALKYLLTYPEPLCQAKPIHLTEEWLLKFGFKFTDNSYLSPTFNLTERLRIIGYEGNFRLVVNKFMTIKIEFVHQLQNLYFALTQEELEMKT